MELKTFFEKLNFLTLIFLAPTQLALHFWPNSAFVFGVRIDLLAPTLYLTDILIVTLMVVWILLRREDFFNTLNRFKWFLLVFLLFVLINTAWSSNFWITALKWLKVFGLALLAMYVSNLKKQERIIMFLTLLHSSVLFSLLGVFHFISGQTLGGLLYFLGERNFNINTPGISLVKISGIDFLRSYSTFPHPNSLAGYFGLVGLIAVFFGLTKENIIKWMLLVIFLSILLSFSLSAYIGIFFAFSFWFLFRRVDNQRIFGCFLLLSILASLCFPFISKASSFNNIEKSIVERMGLNLIAVKMVGESPLIGQGLNTFILNISRFSAGVHLPFVIQPVHNIFLLIFGETGVLGLVLITAIIYQVYKYSKKSDKQSLFPVFVFIIVTGLADHYWLTIQQNLILISLVFGIALQRK